MRGNQRRPILACVDALTKYDVMSGCDHGHNVRATHQRKQQRNTPWALSKAGRVRRRDMPIGDPDTGQMWPHTAVPAQGQLVMTSPGRPEVDAIGLLDLARLADGAWFFGPLDTCACLSWDYNTITKREASG